MIVSVCTRSDQAHTWNLPDPNASSLVRWVDYVVDSVILRDLTIDLVTTKTVLSEVYWHYRP